MNMSKAIASIRDYDEMRKWAVDMTYRGAKVYEIVHDRNANNEKELSVRQGELVEVLDDTRKWWKLRSFYGLVGYAPVTIIRKFEIGGAQNQSIHSITPNHPEKVS